MIAWIKRHYLAIGLSFLALSALIFFFKGRDTQSARSAVEATESGVTMYMVLCARIDVYIVLAIILGALGFGLACYAYFKRWQDKKRLDDALGLNRKR